MKQRILDIFPNYVDYTVSDKRVAVKIHSIEIPIILDKHQIQANNDLIKELLLNPAMFIIEFDIKKRFMKEKLEVKSEDDR